MKGSRAALAALLTALLVTACSSSEPPSTGAVATLHGVTKVAQLQTAFNRDRGHARLIVLLSPT